MGGFASSQPAPQPLPTPLSGTSALERADLEILDVGDPETPLPCPPFGSRPPPQAPPPASACQQYPCSWVLRGCTAGPGSGWKKSLILVRLAEQGSPPTSAVSEVLTVPPQTLSHPKAQVKLLYGRVPGPGETGSTKSTKPRWSGAGAPCAWRDRTGRDQWPALDLVFGEKMPQEAVKTISPSLLLR